jgi:hypothetical protein
MAILHHVTLSVRTPPGADEDEATAAPSYAHLDVAVQPGGFVLQGSGVLYLPLEELACGEADLCRRPICEIDRLKTERDLPFALKISFFFLCTKILCRCEG